MPYRLLEDESLNEGVSRIVGEQTDRAMDSLRQVGEDPHESIHDARKRFKKIRGALRFVRDEVGRDFYKRENVRFRDLGRLLAPLRDAYVRRTTLDRLLEEYDSYARTDNFTQVAESLDREYEKVRDELIWEDDVLQRVRTELSEVRPSLDSWPVEGDDFEVIQGSLARVYRRGRKGLARSREEPSPEHLHDWRKRVKYLWYHLRILRRIWPPLLKRTASLTHDLSDHLGDAHDFSEFQEKIEKQPNLAEERQEREVLLALASQRRRHLEGKALLLGRRIYAEKTKHFIRRLRAYWNAGDIRGKAQPPRVVLATTP